MNKDINNCSLDVRLKKREMLKSHKTTKGILVSLPSGKMKYSVAITTSCTCNSFCQHMQTVNECVCSECYAQTLQELKHDVRKAYERNTELLTRDLSDTDIEEICFLVNSFECGFLRFESFGDLNNEIQLVNYFRICNRLKELNPSLNIALWTKRIDILKKVKASGIAKPENLEIVISSFMKNVPMSIPEEIKPWINKVFTVYTSSYAIENDIDICCGIEKCYNCQICYKHHNNIVYVNELVKSESAKYYNYYKNKIVELRYELHDMDELSLTKKEIRDELKKYDKRTYKALYKALITD